MHAAASRRFRPAHPARADKTPGIGDQRAEALLEELAESYLLRARQSCVNGRLSYDWESGERPFAARQSSTPEMCCA